MKRLAAIESRAPLIFAGNTQRSLIVRAASELHVPRQRLIGSAPAALESAVRALAALEADGSAAEMQLRVVGVPPAAAVIAWEEATASGQPISVPDPAASAGGDLVAPAAPVAARPARAGVGRGESGGSRGQRFPSPLFLFRLCE